MENSEVLARQPEEERAKLVETKTRKKSRFCERSYFSSFVFIAVLLAAIVLGLLGFKPVKFPPSSLKNLLGSFRGHPGPLEPSKLLNPETRLSVSSARSAVRSEPSDERRSVEVPVLWMAPFVSGGGYCSEAIAYVLSLSATRKLPNLQIRQHGDGFRFEFWGGLEPSVREALQALSTNEGAPFWGIAVCHSEPGAWDPPLFQTSVCPPRGARRGGKKRSYVIGRTMFETDRVNAGHVERCNRMDEIWVPTEFHMKTFTESGVDPSKLFKMVQSVDVNSFDPTATKPMRLPIGRRLFGPPINGSFRVLPREHFVFLSVFKWEKRKGWDVLVEAYLQEFSTEDETVLYILTNAFHSEADFEAKIADFVTEKGLKEPEFGWPRLHIYWDHVPQRQLASFYRSCDAFVLPSRGEGWGRPIVEAMAMGLPVIATNWSGMTEYLTAENSFPIPVDRFSTVEEGPFMGHLWAEPSVESLRKLMRGVFADEGERAEKGRKARSDMVEKYNPKVVAGKVLDRLQEIEQRMQGNKKFVMEEKG